MQYLTPKEFKKMMLLSYERVEREKEEINKINVFPVPDQDTGSNMAKTLLGIKEAIENKEFKDLDGLSEVAFDGALSAAQGNAGVIYVGFLAGFLPAISSKNPIDAKKLAQAMKEGAKRARQAIQNPKEGTILDVIDAATESIERESRIERDILNLLKRAVGKAHEALLETREKMEIFKKANVVDAGGLGYLMILEGWLQGLEGEEEEKKEEEKPSEKIRRFVQTLSNRYEIVSLIENPKFNEKTTRERLQNLGNSLDIVEVKDKMKIHIHTDLPDEVKKIMRETGKILSLREEDMAKEIAGEESVREVSIGIVIDDLATLLPKITERYQIEMVFCKVDWPEGEELAGENIYQKMREAEKRGVKTFPKTSQATPKDYLDTFKKQLQKFNKVLCITASSKISGCYNSAKQAEAMVDNPMRVFIFDSLNGAAGEALLVLKAIELIQEKKEITEIMSELKNLTLDIHTCAIFEDPKWIEAGGRVTKSQANWIRRMKKINLRPLVELKNGIVTKGGVVFAHDMTEALFKKILKENKKIRVKGKRIRVVINHADNLKEAKRLKKLLKEKIKAEVSFISLAPPVIAAHTGPGTLIVAWTPIE